VSTLKEARERRLAIDRLRSRKRRLVAQIKTAQKELAALLSQLEPLLAGNRELRGRLASEKRNLYRRGLLETAADREADELTVYYLRQSGNRKPLS
jgi:hypothetical protein